MTREEIKELLEDNNWKAEELIKKYCFDFMKEQDIYCSFSHNNLSSLSDNGYFTDESNFRNLCDAIKNNKYNLDDNYIAEKDCNVFSSNSLKEIAKGLIGKDYLSKMEEISKDEKQIE